MPNLKLTKVFKGCVSSAKNLLPVKLRQKLEGNSRYLNSSKNSQDLSPFEATLFGSAFQISKYNKKLNPPANLYTENPKARKNSKALQRPRRKKKKRKSFQTHSKTGANNGGNPSIQYSRTPQDSAIRPSDVRKRLSKMKAGKNFSVLGRGNKNVVTKKKKSLAIVPGVCSNREVRKIKKEQQNLGQSNLQGFIGGKNMNQAMNKGLRKKKGFMAKNQIPQGFIEKMSKRVSQKSLTGEAWFKGRRNPFPQSKTKASAHKKSKKDSQQNLRSLARNLKRTATKSVATPDQNPDLYYVRGNSYHHEELKSQRSRVESQLSNHFNKRPSQRLMPNFMELPGLPNQNFQFFKNSKHETSNSTSKLPSHRNSKKSRAKTNPQNLNLNHQISHITKLKLHLMRSEDTSLKKDILSDFQEKMKKIHVVQHNSHIPAINDNSDMSFGQNEEPYQSQGFSVLSQNESPIISQDRAFIKQKKSRHANSKTQTANFKQSPMLPGFSGSNESPTPQKTQAPNWSLKMIAKSVDQGITPMLQASEKLKTSLYNHSDIAEAIHVANPRPKIKSKKKIKANKKSRKRKTHFIEPIDAFSPLFKEKRDVSRQDSVKRFLLQSKGDISMKSNITPRRADASNKFYYKTFF